MNLAKSKSHPKAKVAVTRKLAVVIHPMWRDGTAYVDDRSADIRETSRAHAARLQRVAHREVASDSTNEPQGYAPADGRRYSRGRRGAQFPPCGRAADRARMPVMLPREAAGDMRRDGSSVGLGQSKLPSMSAEECTVYRLSTNGGNLTYWYATAKS